MTYKITYFDKQSEELSGERNLNDPSIKEIAELFNVPKDEIEYGCYPILLEHTAFFDELVNIKWNMERFDYFFETVLDD